MRRSVKQTAAALLCGVLTAVCLPALPASADAAPVPEEVPARYDDYDPVGDDVLIMSIPAAEYDQRTKVTIVQHSPERENLVLYECELHPQDGCLYSFRMEPGDYTVSVARSSVRRGALSSVYTEDLTIENADYSVAPDQFDYTCYSIAVEATVIGNDADAAPVSERTETAVTDGCKNAGEKITFGEYDIMRGDYDGNGEITALDAQNILSAFAAELTDDPDAPVLTAAQKAACDIDGNGKLTALDAQTVLMFYAEGMVGGSPLWPDEQSAAEN